MGEARDVLWVGYILVGGEVVIAIFFLFFIVVLSERLKVHTLPVVLPSIVESSISQTPPFFTV